MFNAIIGPQGDESSEVNALKEFVEDATLVISSKDILQAYLSHFDMDSIDIDGYMEEVKTLLAPPSSIPPWTMKYESIPSSLDTSIYHLLKTPPTFKQKLVLVILQELSATFNQQNQNVSIQNEYEKVIRGTITNPPLDYTIQMLPQEPSITVLKQDNPDNLTKNLSCKVLNYT